MKKHLLSLLAAFMLVAFPYLVQAGKHKETPYALNMVYFLPQGCEPVEGYEKRLSDLMTYIQDFYRREMNRNGFGKRTFGMQREPGGLVKILVIRGGKDRQNYGYEGGGWKAQQEIQKYFQSHPEEKKSEHTLVIMPSVSGDDMNPGGVPFYGLGKYCFALDYKYFDIQYQGQDSPQGRLLTKWFGGMAHELGHGLNLPHNMQQVSEGKRLGTALMGAGNYTLGMKPTFLTKASCAILSNCQVFARKEKEFYKNGSFSLENMKISFTGTEILVSGVYKSKIPVAAVNVYVDRAPFGQVNNDYDAESWTVRNREGKFSFEIPRGELHPSSSARDFQIRLLFLCENGTRHTERFNFDWNDLKNLDYIKQ